ncbi:hypothetical protein [Spiroplasma diminutum]|uniref:Transmembrane protein n=1 Tax=Spiroplasma diminutum CUAS-1 TaxID=1276221 RepID=S5MF39_9MOLU|nr:hypothetical protein [Spiroplasma diminutum]AGR42403.1 hypothetical protein SDIMI_v3c06990 [Spiroplasma diminutum CUAS-1]
MRGNRETSGLRLMLMIANIFGLVAGIFGGIAYIYYGFIVFRNDPSQINPEIFNYMPMLMSIAGFFIITNIFFCSFIINFLKKADDITLLNNRYIIALFSISIGGFFTPFVLAQMKNIPIQSTVSPKFTISKGYGGNSLVSGVIALGSYFWFSTVVFKSSNTVFTAGLADQIFVGIVSLIIFWGALNCMLFATPNAKAAWDKKAGAYKFMNFIAIINLIFATFVLIMQLLSSILTIFSIIADLFDRRRGFLGTILNTTFATYRIAVQLFIIYTLNKIIKGLWSKGDQIHYQDYSKLAEKQREYEMNNA